MPFRSSPPACAIGFRRIGRAVAGVVLASALALPLASASAFGQAMPTPGDATGVAPPDGPPGDDWRSWKKALTYQSVVVSTDQLLYWTIVTGAAASDAAFLVANAASGIGYYVAFDKSWTSLGLDPVPGGSEVSVGKAVAYRVFDTARAFAVTLAVGTPLAASVEVTAAIAATRTGIYLLHDYAWSWMAPAASGAPGAEPAERRDVIHSQAMPFAGEPGGPRQ